MSSSTTDTPAGALAETTRDALLGGRITVTQPARGPRTGIDPFFLAAAVPARDGRDERVLEAGLGVGTASLALCARVSDVRVAGVEVQEALARLARANVEENGFAGRLDVIVADIAAPRTRHQAAGLPPNSYHHVFANPPYYSPGSARLSAEQSKVKSYSAPAGALEAWVRYMARMAAPGGTATLIHRAEALDEVLERFNGRFGAVKVFPLFPRQGAPAKRVVVQGVKGSRSPLTMLPGMVLHRADGGYTRDAEAVLRGMEALPLNGLGA